VIARVFHVGAFDVFQVIPGVVVGDSSADQAVEIERVADRLICRVKVPYDGGDVGHSFHCFNFSECRGSCHAAVKCRPDNNLREPNPVKEMKKKKASGDNPVV
jgi:hypothetical protein